MWCVFSVLVGMVLSLIDDCMKIIAFHRRLNLKSPSTLNEKSLYLLLKNYRYNPLTTICADKYLVRKYVEDCGCKEILNELYGVYDSQDEIDRDSTPEKYVLKCNHGCAYNIINNGSTTINRDESVIIMRKWMKDNYWKSTSEVHYRDIPKRIVCEKFLETPTNTLPEDYKIYFLQW